MIHQGMFFVPSTCPSSRLGGKIQCFAVNVQFFVSEHLTRTRSVPTVCDKVPGKEKPKWNLSGLTLSKLHRSRLRRGRCRCVIDLPVSKWTREQLEEKT